ncbi:MAG: lamin tail domain-containing protein [Deltaproteobacteria bacterium]|nr:lamin tail domain-containing protein [Deltaproteobacteria bacterium]
MKTTRSTRNARATLCVPASLGVLVLASLGACTNDTQTENRGTPFVSNPSDGGASDVGASDIDAPDAGVANDAGTHTHFARFILNEIAAEGEPKDWFEVYNPSDEPIDLSRYTYTDDFADPGKALFPPSARIEPHGYYVQYLDDASPGFKLGVDEEVTIFDPALNLVDMVDWKDGDSPIGTSFGRMPNGTGPFTTLATPTPGAMNIAGGCGNDRIDGAEVCDGANLLEETCETLGFASGELRCADDCTDFDRSACVAEVSRRVVLNEVTSDGDDQIELYNDGTAPIALAGWFVADDGYDALDPTTADHLYALTEGTTIGAHGFLVLTKDIEHTFGLGRTDGVRLYDETGLLVDEVHWDQDAASPSFCRMPDGVGAFAHCDQATFGSTNTP